MLGMLNAIFSSAASLKAALDNNQDAKYESTELYSGYSPFIIKNSFEAKALGLSFEDEIDHPKLTATKHKIGTINSLSDRMLSYFYFYSALKIKYTNTDEKFDKFIFEIFTRFLFNFNSIANDVNYHTNPVKDNAVKQIFNELKSDEDSLKLVLEIENFGDVISNLIFYFYFASQNDYLKEKFKESLLDNFSKEIKFTDFNNMSLQARDIFFTEASEQFLKKYLR